MTKRVLYIGGDLHRVNFHSPDTPAGDQRYALMPLKMGNISMDVAVLRSLSNSSVLTMILSSLTTERRA